MSKLKRICSIAKKGKKELIIIVILCILIVCVNICGKDQPIVGIINSLATSAIITMGWNVVVKYNDAKQSYIQITVLVRLLIKKLSISKDLSNATITVQDIKRFNDDINSTYINIYAVISNLLVSSECDAIIDTLRDIMSKIESGQDCQNVTKNIEQLKESLNNFDWH